MKTYKDHPLSLFTYRAIKTGKAWDRLVSPPNVAPPMADSAKCYAITLPRYSQGTSDRLMKGKREGSGVDPDGLLYGTGRLAVNSFGPEVRS